MEGDVLPRRNESFISLTYPSATLTGVTPNQLLQLSFAAGCSFAVVGAMSYLTRSPEVSQLLVSTAMFLNVAGAILSKTSGDL